MSDHQESLNLLQYQPAIQIFQDMKDYHQNLEQRLQYVQIPKTQDIINAIFPPIDWTDHNNKLHIQYVSHQPASREDVIQLKKRLIKMLDDRQAKTSGICGIRQELFSQTFDQIIRQVAIDCPERGLLLMRVRDQHRMTLAAYQTIYQSSVSYGIRKQIESEEGTENLEEQLKRLQQKKQTLENKKDALICDKELLERRIKETRIIESQKREQELKFIHLQVQNLTKFLESVKSELKNANN